VLPPVPPVALAEMLTDEALILPESVKLKLELALPPAPQSPSPTPPAPPFAV